MALVLVHSFYLLYDLSPASNLLVCCAGILASSSFWSTNLTYLGAPFIKFWVMYSSYRERGERLERLSLFEETPLEVLETALDLETELYLVYCMRSFWVAGDFESIYVYEDTGVS